MKRVRILTAYGQGGILDKQFEIRDDQYVEVVKIEKPKKCEYPAACHHPCLAGCDDI